MKLRDKNNMKIQEYNYALQLDLGDAGSVEVFVYFEVTPDEGIPEDYEITVYKICLEYDNCIVDMPKVMLTKELVDFIEKETTKEYKELLKEDDSMKMEVALNCREINKC